MYAIHVPSGDKTAFVFRSAEAGNVRGLAAGLRIDSGTTEISLAAFAGVSRAPITVLPSGETEVGISPFASLVIVEGGPLRSTGADTTTVLLSWLPHA